MTTPKRGNSTVPLIVGGALAAVAIIVIGVDIGIGRDPGTLVNFCGIILANAAMYLGLQHKVSQTNDTVERTNETVEDLANGTGDRKIRENMRAELGAHGFAPVPDSPVIPSDSPPPPPNPPTGV